jgi:hypothetical protein
MLSLSNVPRPHPIVWLARFLSAFVFTDRRRERSIMKTTYGRWTRFVNFPPGKSDPKTLAPVGVYNIMPDGRRPEAQFLNGKTE